MQLYCVAIECKNDINEEQTNVRIDHFFANNEEQMEDRLYEIIKAIKEEGIETIKHIIFPINKVDGLDVGTIFKMIRFPETNKENTEIEQA